MQRALVVISAGGLTPDDAEDFNEEFLKWLLVSKWAHWYADPSPTDLEISTTIYEEAN